MDLEPKFDMLVFFCDGNNNKACIIRDVTQDEAVSCMSDMEMYQSYLINGCVQLAHEQTQFKDTTIINPAKFLVSLDDGYTFLHDLPVWDKVNNCLEGLPKEGGDDDGRDFSPPYEP
jgi:hypothetical protein